MFIKTKEYKLSYIPETKSYELKAELYDEGSIFSENYKIAEVQSPAEIQKTGKTIWEKLFG